MKKKNTAPVLNFTTPIFAVVLAWVAITVIHSDMHRTRPVNLYIELEQCDPGDLTCVLWNDYQRKGGSL
jgi:hypothetical protein